MSIKLNGKPSVDGLGVKRWTYALNDQVTLHVFERPSNMIGDQYLLRLDHKDGRTLDMRLARWKSQATEKAQWLEMRVAKGEYAKAKEPHDLRFMGNFVTAPTGFGCDWLVKNCEAKPNPGFTGVFVWTTPDEAYALLSRAGAAGLTCDYGSLSPEPRP